MRPIYSSYLARKEDKYDAPYASAVLIGYIPLDFSWHVSICKRRGTTSSDVKNVRLYHIIIVFRR